MSPKSVSDIHFKVLSSKILLKSSTILDDFCFKLTVKPIFDKLKIWFINV